MFTLHIFSFSVEAKLQVKFRNVTLVAMKTLVYHPLVELRLDSTKRRKRMQILMNQILACPSLDFVPHSRPYTQPQLVVANPQQMVQQLLLVHQSLIM